MDGTNIVKRYTKSLDYHAENLPVLYKWLEVGAEPYGRPTSLVLDFITDLEDIINAFEVEDVHQSDWHEYCRRINFSHVKSPHFKKGNILKKYNFPVDENLEGVIAVGFDEGLEYDDNAKPELIIWYQNANDSIDMNLFNPKEWKTVLAEFFKI